MENKNENNDIRLLFKVRESVLTTLKDRGYDIPLGATKLSFDDFKVLLEQERHHLYFPDLEPIGLKEEFYKGGGILVYFEPVDRLDLKIFKTRLAQLNKEYPDLDKLFFVIKTYGNSKKLSNFVKTELLKHPNVEILENIYPFDIMKNSVLPECFLLSEEEKNAVIEILDTSLNNFPKFELSDPVAVRFGAKVGDMFYIKRNGGLELSYRVVVKTGSG